MATNIAVPAAGGVAGPAADGARDASTGGVAGPAADVARDASTGGAAGPAADGARDASTGGAADETRDAPPDVSTNGTPGATAHLLLEDRIWLLRAMLLMRGLEERAMTLYRQGKVPGSFYDGCGQEAVSAGAAFAMAPQDRLCILHRDLAAHLIRGVPPARVLGQYLGRDNGVTRGRDGNVHFGDRALGCVGMVSMLPDMMLVATGMAMAFKIRGERRCALTWLGDGSSSRGDCHEAMNWAGVQKLPVVFVLENNQYAYSTPLDKQFAVDPVKRAAGYGFAGVTVDGNDVEAVFEATRDARERALRGEGPSLIEAVTMRMHGHAAHDDMKYVPIEQVEEWRRRDPIDRQEDRLRELGVDVDAVRASVQDEIDAATEEALAAPMPDPASAADGAFCEGEAEPLGNGIAPWSGFARSAAVTAADAGEPALLSEAGEADLVSRPGAAGGLSQPSEPA